MLAATWTAIGLMAATLVGSLWYLGQRIDGLGARLDARIDAQGADLGTRIEALSGQIDALSGRIDALAARFDQHLERHAG